MRRIHAQISRDAISYTTLISVSCDDPKEAGVKVALPTQPPANTRRKYLQAVTFLFESAGALESAQLSQPTVMIAPKNIHKNSIAGQQGVNLIERTVLAMGFLWYPTGGVEGGIDGSIELRDADSGHITNSIIQVQSKADPSQWTAETSQKFDYLCNARDLEYWMNGNAPVILVVSRPDTEESYWVSIKNYFSDLSVRQARKIHFDKEKHKFDASCKTALIELAVPREAGIYFAPASKPENLYSNLIEVAGFAPHIYVAATECRKPQEIWERFRALDQQMGNEWILKDKSIFSFHDLREYPWDQICEKGSVEDFDSAEWAYSDDREMQKDFVRLLNQSLNELTRSRGLRRIDRRNRVLYFFRADRHLRARQIQYKNIVNMTSKEVFGARESKKTKGKISYYRHSAFHASFQRYEDQWYLEINPTYHFTRNGYEPLSDDFYSQRLKGIKMLEKNPALLGQLLMWVSHLRQHEDGLFPSQDYPLLQLGDLHTFAVDFGIHDTEWLNRDDNSKDLQKAFAESGLFKS